MRNSPAQREAVRQHCLRMNAENNPMKRPEVIAKANKSREKYWKSKTWKAKMLRKRKKNHYTPPTFAYSWGGMERPKEATEKYREFTQAKKQLRELAVKHGIKVDIVSLDKEQTLRMIDTLKKLPE